MLIINPWNCVDLGSQPCGRHYINGLYAQPLKTGLLIDKCFDVGRVENVHFWPFWMDNEKLKSWTKHQATAFVIARTDWEMMSNCFCIFYKVGFHFVAKKDGGGNAMITNSGSDLGPTAVKVDHVQDHSGVTFTNCQFMSTIDVDSGNKGPAKFTACGFWGTEETASHAIIRGKGNVTFDNCHFIDWARGDKAAPCIVAHEGGVTISASEFLDRDAGKRHIQLDEKVDSAIIMGNRFRTPPKIDNRAKGDVQIGLNTGPKSAK